MKFIYAMLLCCAASMSNVGLAAQAGHNGPVEIIQVDTSAYVGREHVVWIRLTGAWSGTSCPADWAWFNAEDDPETMATVLMSRATSAALSVYVDDTLPKISGYCRVLTLTMN
jgi:hypothetical protein